MHRKIVAMHGLGQPGLGRSLARGTAQLGGVGGREALGERRAVGPADRDRVAGPEASLDALAAPTASRLAPCSSTARRAPASTVRRPELGRP